MKVLPTVKKNKRKIKTFEHVQVLMYHKNESIDAHVKPNIKHLLGVGMMLLPQF
jgi:hypothetical protein